MLFILLGPTASGKERIALELAGRMNAEILSVDSMKIYRGLDIGTAKASAGDRALRPHHGLDIAHPDETFSVAQYAAAAERILADIRSRNRPAILSGGTALYYMALLQGLFDGPGRDDGLRARLEAMAAGGEPERLWRMLSGRDAAAAGRIHPNDTRRLIRALEVLELSGRPISSLQGQWENRWRHSRHAFRMVRLAWPRALLRQRISARLERMRREGLLEEARGVWERREAMAAAPLQAVAYKEFFPFFGGLEPEEAAWERLRRGTTRLAKAQETWFKRFPAVPIACHELPPAEPGFCAAAADAISRAWGI